MRCYNNQPASFDMYTLELEYSRTEMRAICLEMDMKLEAIASMSGMSGILSLKVQISTPCYQFLKIIYRVNNIDCVARQSRKAYRWIK